MKTKIRILLLGFFSLFILSCNNNSSHSHGDADEVGLLNEDVEFDDEGYIDGTYCAEVECYNPSTGTRNTYDLDVEVEGGELTEVLWPNGGWLDNSHFYPEDVADGQCEFTSDRGYRYTVTLGEYGGCDYTDQYRIRQDVIEEVEATTCPRCGDEKDSFDDYCYYCKRKKMEDEQKNTCSRCGSYEYGVFGGLCSNCKRDDR